MRGREQVYPKNSVPCPTTARGCGGAGRDTLQADGSYVPLYEGHPYIATQSTPIEGRPCIATQATHIEGHPYAGHPYIGVPIGGPS